MRRLVPFAMTFIVTACAGDATSVTSSEVASPTAAPSAPSAQPTSAAPSPSATPTPVAGGLHLTWSDEPFGDQVDAVIADGSRIVAVGGATDARAAWTSTDGRSWQRDDVPNPTPDECAAIDDPFCLPAGARMGQLVRLGETLYAFGNAGPFNDGVLPVGWRWTDGASWQLIRSESEFFRSGGIVDVTASDAALLAVKDGPYQYSQTVWLWTPETSWIETGLASSAEEPIAIADTAWSGDTYVAVGVAAELQPEQDAHRWPVAPSIWASSDGQNWSSVRPPADAFRICSVSATSMGFVALGLSDAGPAAWTSVEGSTWTAAAVPASTESVLDPSTIGSSVPCGGAIAELDGGLLAVLPLLRDASLTWTSIDGSHWEEGESLDVTVPRTRIAAFGQTVVLFGFRGDPSAPGVTSVLIVGKVDP